MITLATKIRNAARDVEKGRGRVGVVDALIQNDVDLGDRQNIRALFLGDLNGSYWMVPHRQRIAILGFAAALAKTGDLVNPDAPVEVQSAGEVLAESPRTFGC